MGKSEWDSWCKRFHTLEKDFRMQKRENERLKRDLDKKGRNEARAEARLARMKMEFEEMKHMVGVQNISRWGIEQALQTSPGSGLTIDKAGSRAQKWLLFGLEDLDPSIWNPTN